MGDIARQVGQTSQIIEIFIGNSSVTTGAGLTGLTNASSGLLAYYKRNTGNASVAISLSAGTLGTWSSGGFKEVDATNMSGLYELGIPNAALASGADEVIIMLQGATNMRPVMVVIELTATNNQDGTRGGMTALPNGSTRVKKNAALNAFPFPMFDLTGSPRTGLTVTAQRSLDGGAFANCANSVTETSGGWYQINLAAGDLNADTVALKFTASGVQDTDFTLVTQP